MFQPNRWSLSLIQLPDIALGERINHVDKFLPPLRVLFIKNSVGLVIVRVLMVKTVPEFHVLALLSSCSGCVVSYNTESLGIASCCPIQMPQRDCFCRSLCLAV